MERRKLATAGFEPPGTEVKRGVDLAYSWVLCQSRERRAIPCLRAIEHLTLADLRRARPQHHQALPPHNERERHAHRLLLSLTCLISASWVLSAWLSRFRTTKVSKETPSPATRCSSASRFEAKPSALSSRFALCFSSLWWSLWQGKRLRTEVDDDARKAQKAIKRTSGREGERDGRARSSGDRDSAQGAGACAW